MAGKTGIQWTDATWNPVVGCSIVSPGCTNCYAMKMAGRIERMNPSDGNHYVGTVQQSKGGPVWTGKVALAPEHILTAPLRWKRPRRVFVNSMGDLFHESVPDAWIDRVFAVMALAPQHTFQCLTKRSKRMREYFAGEHTQHRIAAAALRAAPMDMYLAPLCIEGRAHRQYSLHFAGRWPLPNVHLGVSAEDQTRADERIPDLLATPAAVRFVSAEPLLGGIDFGSIIRRLTLGGSIYADGKSHPLGWVIVGGESGPGARTCWTPDVRSIVKQCKSAGVPVFVKQMGANVQDRNDAGFEGCEPHEWPDIDPFDVEHDVNGYREEYQGAPCRIKLKNRKGADMAEWPEDLRVREMPT